MFNISGVNYRIQSATLTAVGSERSGEIKWGILVKCEEREDLEEMGWEPALVADALFRTPAGAIRSWRDVVGATGNWGAAAEPEPEAFLEVYELNVIYNCHWDIRSLTPGSVDLQLFGQADVDSDHSQLNLRIETPLAIAPWWMGRESEATCLERYRRFGLQDPVEFRLQEHGVSSLVFLNQ